MKGRIVFVLGAATGYVLGTRAGRQAYEKIKQRASSLWHSSSVQDGVSSAGAFAREKIPVVGKTLGDVADSAVESADSQALPDAPAPDAASAPGDGDNHHG
jgi:hypothetical protein